MLEPLCGPRHSRAGWTVRARNRRGDLAALPGRARGSAIWRADTAVDVAIRRPRAGQPGLRRRARDAGPAAGQGLGPRHRLLPLPVRSRRGATTSTSSSATTAATPATTSCAETSPTWSCDQAPATRRPACCTTPTRARPSRSPAGPTTSDAVQIDHLVSLRTLGTRARANGTTSDAATSPTTRATCWPSADKPTSTRLFAMRPHGCRPTRRFRCEFVARQIDVKAAYGLWLSANEKRAMQDVLARCYQPSSTSPPRGVSACVIGTSCGSAGSSSTSSSSRITATSRAVGPANGSVRS